MGQAPADRPTPDTDSETWWAAIQDQQVDGQRLPIMLRENSLYARPFCPHCWSEDVALTPASGRARLYTWSVVHQNAAPFADRTPYVVAMVDLVEGPRLMTVIEGCPIEDLATGPGIGSRVPRRRGRVHGAGLPAGARLGHAGQPVGQVPRTSL